MRFIDRIKAAANVLVCKSSDSTALRQWLSAFGISAGLEGAALNEATYYTCLKVLSESIGKLPFGVLLKTPKDGVVPQTSHRYWRTLHTRPNPYMTARDFWTLMEFWRNHHGNAYAWIDERRPQQPCLWPLDPEHMQLYYDNAKALSEQPDIYYAYTFPNGHRRVYKSAEVLHFKSHMTVGGLVGIPVCEQLASTIDSQIRAQQVIERLYANGMTAKAVLQYTGSISDALVKQLIENIKEYASDESTDQVIPLPLGYSMQPLNLKLADAQFFELKQLSALQIAAAFGVKPSQIGDYSKSSYATAEAQQLAFLIDTLLFNVTGYDQELTGKLLLMDEEEEGKGLIMKAQTDILLRADTKTKIETLSKAVANFLYTPTEARAELDKHSVDGGDRLLGNGSTISQQAVDSQDGAGDPAGKLYAAIKDYLDQNELRKEEENA